MKRGFDIVFSLAGILILSPFLLLFSLLIILDSGFPVFFVQKRVGKGSADFSLFKFRTMHTGADQKGLLTVGSKDPRITRIGYFLRSYKIDELPQLFNVLFGTMSLVGPRPEVRKYVSLYSEEQKKVLSVKPGITDYASMIYSNENEILSRTDNPEQHYIGHVMPAKLKLNLKYLENRGLLTDLSIILKTVGRILS